MSDPARLVVGARVRVVGTDEMPAGTTGTIRAVGTYKPPGRTMLGCDVAIDNEPDDLVLWWIPAKYLEVIGL